MDLVDHARAIWDRRWYVILASMVVSAVAFAWSSSRPRVFQTALTISVESGRAVTDGGVPREYVSFLAFRYAEVATTTPVLDDAATRSGLGISGAEAAGHVAAKSSDDAFIHIAVTGPSTHATAALAHGLADALVAAVGAEHARTVEGLVAPLERERQGLQRELEASRTDSVAEAVVKARLEGLVNSENARRYLPPDRLVLISEGTAPGPVAPHPSRDAFLALLAAAIVNAELVVVFSSLRARHSTQTRGGENGQRAAGPAPGTVTVLGEAARSRYPAYNVPNDR